MVRVQRPLNRALPSDPRLRTPVGERKMPRQHSAANWLKLTLLSLYFSAVHCGRRRRRHRSEKTTNFTDTAVLDG